MAFFKKVLKTVEQEVVPAVGACGSHSDNRPNSKRLAAESTVSPADVKAVLEALSGVMGDYMAQGRSVKLDGIGSFFFQSSATGNGKDKAEDVSASDINGVKVRFIPETTYISRSLNEIANAISLAHKLVGNRIIAKSVCKDSTKY